MYSKTHSISIKGDNTGSCKSYAEYLDKSEGKFFNSNGEYEKSEIYVDIDKHSKGQLGKDDAKWYAPIYSFSENESQHIAEKVTGRKVYNYEDLTENEKEKYNEKIKDLAIKYQDEMAANFNKKDIGINDNKDLKWYAKIEHQRQYKGYDEEVKKGMVKSGAEKKGFNTHIHVIQSRKANNEKKSKLSPESSQKNRTTKNKVQQGFDRQNYKKRIENTFDRETEYKRGYDEKYEYYRLKKINNLKELESYKQNHLNNENMKTIKEHHQEVSQNPEVENYNDYSKEMEKRNIEVREIQNKEKETYDLELQDKETNERERFSKLIKEQESEEIQSKWVQEQKEREEQIKQQIERQEQTEKETKKQSKDLEL